MARIKFSSLVSDISGSIGGATFQKNSYGTTLRNKPINSRIRNVNQSRLLSVRSLVLNQWAAMSVAQRKVWDAFVDYAPQFAKKNSNSLLSGYNLFVAYNSLRYLQAGTFLTTPGFSPFNVPAPSVSIKVISVFLNIYWGLNASTYSFIPIISLSAPLRQTEAIPINKLRQMYQASFDPTFISCHPQYISYFGRIPVVGEVVAWKLQLIGSVTPIILKPIYGFFTVIADT